MSSATHKVNHTLVSAAAFILWYTIALLVSNVPHCSRLKEQGMLVPLLCLLEFAALVPFYQGYRQRFAHIAAGKLRVRQLLLFFALLLTVIASQSLYLQPESWSSDQSGTTPSGVLFFSLAVVLLAPVFEEILFRGLILQAFLLWAPHQRLACSLMTSIIFAALHSQYVHLQTLISLFVLSLLLCAARLVSGGLKLPIMLHMLNNLSGVAPILWLSFSR